MALAGAAAVGAAWLRVRPPRPLPIVPLPRALSQRPADGKKRVVVLGAGFAGLAFAHALQDELHGIPMEDVERVIIDRNNYHLFTPLLYQVATCGVGPWHIVEPVRRIVQPEGWGFWEGAAQSIDFEQRTLHLDNGSIPYDELVIATGSTTNFFGNDEIRQHVLPLKGVREGVAIRDTVIAALERASHTDDPEERQRALRFVIVGGGATGVETACALADLCENVVPSDYPTLSRAEVHVVVIESAGKLLEHMAEPMPRLAQQAMERKHIEVCYNRRADHVTARTVHLSDGTTLEAETIIWTAGVRASDFAHDLPLEKGKGDAILVDRFLRVREHPEVYAIGDNAHVDDPAFHAQVPLLAQSAIQMGECAAANVASDVRGGPRAPFVYRELGNSIALGRFDGATQVAGYTLGGLLGWAGWRVIHLVRITMFRKRLEVLLDWSLGWADHEDIADLRLTAQDSPAPPRPRRRAPAASRQADATGTSTAP
jgi:NADH dehydrogenase